MLFLSAPAWGGLTPCQSPALFHTIQPLSLLGKCPCSQPSRLPGCDAAHHGSLHGASPLFPALYDVPGSSWASPALVTGSPVSPRIPGSFLTSGIRNSDLGTRLVRRGWAVVGPWPFSTTEQRCSCAPLLTVGRLGRAGLFLSRFCPLIRRSVLPPVPSALLMAIAWNRVSLELGECESTSFVLRCCVSPDLFAFLYKLSNEFTDIYNRASRSLD